ncbi:hypothetical protein J2T18_002750 [Paenibacillus polymyxa]|nr:hypothetical protein [Paenibacillus polymyxa]
MTKSAMQVIASLCGQIRLYCHSGAGDNLYDLECVGLNREDCGLLGSMPEYVETLQLDDMTVYKIAVMYTNDFIMTFFTQKGIHAEEIEQWLNEQANIC